MSDIETSTLHHNRAEINGTVQLLFSEGVTTRAEAAAKGYLDMGNFTGVEFKGEAAKTEVYKCYRGVTRLGGNLPGILKHGYDLTTNELADARKLRFALLGNPGAPYAQAAIADTAGDALDFTASAPAILNLWYPLFKGGAQVREITAITITDLVEGKDYLIDAKLGLIRFINEATLPVEEITPVLSAPAITAEHPLGLRSVRPMTRGFWKGYARLLVWDQDPNQNLVLDHQNFSCEISLSSPPSFTHDALAELKIRVTDTGDIGEVILLDESKKSVKRRQNSEDRIQ
jgi:hypothetical protein